jgi:hypothetical protein
MRASWERNTKKIKNSDTFRGSMHSGQMHGLDYTPLFKFLLSRIGSDWVATHKEALARLDREEPIFWMVTEEKETGVAYFRNGENSYFSKLYINEDGVLSIVDPAITKDTLEPSCGCCTHTFNGHPFSRRHTAKAV